MRAFIESWTVPLIVLSLGCQPPPAEVVDDGTASEDPPPGSTSAGSTAGSADSTTAGPADGSGGSTSGSSSIGAAESSSSGADDSSTGEPTDVPLGPFGAPQAVEELNSLASEDDPSLTGDLLEIYFASTRNGGGEDIWRSTRDSVDVPWTAPQSVDELNTFSTETFPEVSADGLVILFASDRGLGGDLDVYVSQRAARGQAWSTPVILSGAAMAGSNDWGATLVPDQDRVFLCRDGVGGLGQVDLWEAQIDVAAAMLGPVAHVPELSSEFAECSVSLSPSRREIFFESTRPIGVGYDWNLWVATRADDGMPWYPPEAVEELNGELDEIDPWLSPDRRTLWFAGGTVGTYDLYVATRR